MSGQSSKISYIRLIGGQGQAASQFGVNWYSEVSGEDLVGKGFSIRVIFGFFTHFFY